LFELHWIPLRDVSLDWDMDRYLEHVMASVVAS